MKINYTDFEIINIDLNGNIEEQIEDIFGESIRTDLDYQKLYNKIYNEFKNVLYMDESGQVWVNINGTDDLEYLFKCRL